LPGVTCHSVDLNWPQELPALLEGVDTLYYLVHSMGEGGNFIAHERQVAMNVRDALLQTPVKQVIFLSSLQAPANEQSDHLRARQLTADTLRSANIPVTELRAGIIGAGSAAFEVMRDMVYNLPVLTPPRCARAPRRLRWRIYCIIWWRCWITRRTHIACWKPLALKC
jgi:uncharacterized protein YbjT (DUF2867 family)